MCGKMSTYFEMDTIRGALTQLHVGVAVMLLLLTALGIRRWRQHKMKSRRMTVLDEKKGYLQNKEQLVEALEGFDWQKTEPQKLRPYKPKYNITMGLQSDSLSNLIVMDKNYADRVSLRRTLLSDHPTTVHGHLPRGDAAVRELYSFLMSSYLPTRYPSMFRLSASGETLQNLVTGVDSPVSISPSDGNISAAIATLAETVEDDMFLLRQTEPGGPHVVDAFVCCFPAGFDPSEKLGLLLRDVHGPVPGYDKIGVSMERFFGRLEVGKGVKRMNWSIQTNTKLFNPKAHTTPEDDITEEDVHFDMGQACARMELQTLTRLPHTRAILFSFKTYLYPLSEIKAEGGGPALADAIDGLTEGNAPAMWVYKGGGKWAERVCEYLRS